MDIPLKITRGAKTKNIETKRVKKGYRIVYDKHVIVEDYKTLAWYSVCNTLKYIL